MSNDPLMKCHETDKGSVLTPRGRMYFCAVAERWKDRNSKDPNDEGKYQVTLVIPPDADVKPLLKLIEQAAKDEWGKVPGNMKSPMKLCKNQFTKDGDASYPEEMADWYQLRANTYQQPGVVGPDNRSLSKLREGEAIEDVTTRLKEHCFSGKWARLSVQTGVFDHPEGGKGVKFWLQNLQILPCPEGESEDQIGGRGGAKAEEEFMPVEGFEAFPEKEGDGEDLSGLLS